MLNADTGQSDEDCDLAEKMITKLLQVDSEECQSHMKQQLRELQALNGTLRDDDFCHICGMPDGLRTRPVWPAPMQ
jgi:splicing factor 1